MSQESSHRLHGRVRLAPTDRATGAVTDWPVEASAPEGERPTELVDIVAHVDRLRALIEAASIHGQVRTELLRPVAALQDACRAAGGDAPDDSGRPR